MPEWRRNERHLGEYATLLELENELGSEYTMLVSHLYPELTTDDVLAM